MAKRPPRKAISTSEHPFRDSEPALDEAARWGRCETEEQIEERCKVFHEESTEHYQRALEDGTYTEREVSLLLGTIDKTRLWWARTMLQGAHRLPGYDARLSTWSLTYVEEHWARVVIAKHVGKQLDERLDASGMSSANANLARERWWSAVLECRFAAEPELVIWAEEAATARRFF